MIQNYPDLLGRETRNLRKIAAGVSRPRIVARPRHFGASGQGVVKDDAKGMAVSAVKGAYAMFHVYPVMAP